MGDDASEKSPRLDLLSSLQKTREKCGYGAPYVAVIKDGIGRLAQGCCNHWDCPRCRWTLAAYHKHRMIEGAIILLADGPLYFWTTTCIGRELDLKTADDDYYLWTNRLLSTCRARAKKQGQRWEYTQVTERQQRGAAHSHFMHTFLPDDAVPRTIVKTGKSGEKITQAVMYSEWFIRSNTRAGLGRQCVITEVDNAVGVAAYISGYLEKQLSADVWPRKWKRIRYSRGWPDNGIKPDWAAAMTNQKNWNIADKQGVVFHTDDLHTYEVAKHHMAMVTYSETKP